MIVDSPFDVHNDNLFFRLTDFGPGFDVFLKLEGLNLAGSIKLKPAVHMIEKLERRGVLRPGVSRVVESSSGNLGVALSLVCKAKGYSFTCVTDPNAPLATRRLIAAYGAELVVVGERDENGGYLHTRIRYIRRLLASDHSFVWTNQYANPANPESHHLSTAAEVDAAFPRVDWLFVGAGTTGTLGGCARYFAEHGPETRLVAVDTVGSVTFGHPAGRRHIPGLGSSRRPEILDLANVADVVLVPEAETVAACWEVRDRYGLLIGGSTGTVLAATRRASRDILPGDTVVAVSADLGDRYADTVYDPAWVREHIGVVPSPWQLRPTEAA
jgi:N-(2-amino-2-carboxyethyl)-L-glutamate synthase